MTPPRLNLHPPVSEPAIFFSEMADDKMETAVLKELSRMSIPTWLANAQRSDSNAYISDQLLPIFLMMTFMFGCVFFGFCFSKLFLSAEFSEPWTRNFSCCRHISVRRDESSSEPWNRFRSRLSRYYQRMKERRLKRDRLNSAALLMVSSFQSDSLATSVNQNSDRGVSFFYSPDSPDYGSFRASWSSEVVTMIDDPSPSESSLNGSNNSDGIPL